ncbi:MAG: lipocalin-like domain-containing protein [Puniceicoccaceae bacterium]
MKFPSQSISGYLIVLCLFAGQVAASGEVPLLTEDGFLVPQPGTPLTFPEDHGNHPEYKIEWWYLTGHLTAASRKRFGYQATFFRSALKTGGQADDGSFGTSQLYLTHMAFTDEADEKFYFEQRLSRDGWDAYSRQDQMDVRNGPWHLAMVDVLTGKMELQASVKSDVRWDLQLLPQKPLLRFGADGTSRKGPAPEARSFYLTFSRLETRGTVQIGDEEFVVSGSSWMDHEIASSQLDPDYIGWDWIAIQLKDGWEIKAYLLRESDGSPSPFSALYWIDPEGQTHYRGPEAFSWEKSRTWRSPDTGAVYPNAPVIETAHPGSGRRIAFRFQPILNKQELTFPGATYWEGAGRVLDESGSEIGSAYLELVGYAGPIAGLR